MNSKTTTIGNEERLLPLFQQGILRLSDQFRVFRLSRGEWVSAEYSKGSRRGHLMTRVYLDGECIRVSSHRLIYRVLVGPIPEGMVVDHKDGDKVNNDPANLRAVSPQRNTQFAIEMGQRGQHGEENPRAKISDEIAHYLREVWETGAFTARELSEWFGIHPSTVRRIANGDRRGS